MEYEFDVVHGKEIRHQAADALCRPQTTAEVRTPLEEDLPILAVHVTENEGGVLIADVNCEEVLSLNAQSQSTDNTPPSEEEMILERANDNYYRVAATQAGDSTSEFTVDENGLFIRKSPVTEAKQTIVPLCLQ